MSIEVDHSRHVCYFVARIWLLIKCAVNNSINVTGWPVCSQSALHDCAAQLHHGNSVLGTLHVRVIQKSDTFPSAAWTTTSSRRSTISDLLGDRRATVLVRDGKRTEDLQRGCGQYVVGFMEFIILYSIYNIVWVAHWRERTAQRKSTACCRCPPP